MQPSVGERRPQSFERVLSSMCTEPHPAASRAAERFIASNPGDPGTYDAVADLETEAVAALGELAGLPEAHGYVTSGGTEANVQAVHAARNLGNAGNSNLVAPESAHFSFSKAAELLGMELRTVPTDGDHRADVDAVAAAVDDDTALVVGVAGSTEYGRVDPIPELAAVAEDAGTRFHVDAAWGGFYLPFTDHEWDFADAAVDTLTVDPHKVGRAVVPAGGLLARDAATLDALAVETPYLETPSQASLTGTRSGAGVASAAAALAELWPAGYRAEYERAADLAAWFAGELSERGYRAVDPELPLVAVDLPDPLFDELREVGWRITRTGAGEARVVVMPHVSRERLEVFLGTLDRLAGTVGV
ncbi:tyrosine decarboxylase MfnA [Halorarum halophilum]|uniref:Probable L-aspartate decarboxylase n=1 Tax=Halorarum halophilum TaxID=2743090 RepID=A0A7D5GA77_9EURY|nr:tyrosine decarboxylase MfnA [Halobaculum halophilum]QLG26386.1 tyrosine decarboxylase MfnA [Halobaculum halophilum]